MTFFRSMILAIALAAGGLAFASSAEAAPAETPSAQLESLLRAHPELILDILRDHSEELLDIVQSGSDKRRRGVLLKQWESDVKTHKNVALAGRPVGGADEAPVTIVAFSDFLCSYCHQAAFTIGNLMKKYPGRIRLVFKQTPKTDAGRTAGTWFVAAYRTDRAKAWKMYALLFDRQQEVEKDTLASLRAIAAEAGFDAAKLESSAKAHGREIGEMMDADIYDANALGFAGTPYFLVNDLVLRGALPLENFEDAVEFALRNTGKAAK